MFKCHKGKLQDATQTQKRRLKLQHSRAVDFSGVHLLYVALILALMVLADDKISDILSHVYQMHSTM